MCDVGTLRQTYLDLAALGVGQIELGELLAKAASLYADYRLRFGIIKQEDRENSLRLMLDALAAEMSASQPFFAAPMKFALSLLHGNLRNEAALFEPLEELENRAGFAYMRTIRWNEYRYSAILAPGAGSPIRRQRVAIAASRFLAGEAPILIVSGGVVHPYQTPDSEALDMKRQLISEFRIPERAILIDPHARHTTTNLRNAARHLHRYGAPFDKELLITTDPSQSAYIEGNEFRERCLRELGYTPMEIRSRISALDLVAVPKLDALSAQPLDPLDP